MTPKITSNHMITSDHMITHPMITEPLIITQHDQPPQLYNPTHDRERVATRLLIIGVSMIVSMIVLLTMVEFLS